MILDINLINKIFKIMKTQFTHTWNKAQGTLVLVAIFMIAALAFNPMYAQAENASATKVQQNERTIKGVISNEYGPLESANIILKGTKVGTVSDSKGEFTFPKALKTGDILVVSYLGFETIEVTIKDDTTFLKLVLAEDLLEFVGALNSNKPYKSKR